jgi:hypothetical protein
MFAEAFRKPVYAPLKCISLKASRLEVTILLWMIYIVRMLDYCLELSKIKFLRMLDLQTQSAIVSDNIQV